MTATHELPATLFDGLAAGGGGPAAIEALRAAQLSKHMLLIGHLLKRWPGPEPERDAIVGPAPTASLAAAGGRLTITACGAVLDVPVAPTEELDWWQPVRHLAAEAAGQAISLGLDDVD